MRRRHPLLLLPLVLALAPLARAEPPAGPVAAVTPESVVPAQPLADASTVRLVLTGDVALNWRGTDPSLKVFPWSRNPLRLLAPFFRAADLAVVNVEGVWLERNPNYAVKHLNLWAPAASAQVFAPAGVHLGSTANNHAFDGKDVGVLENLERLHRTGLKTMGTGRTEEEARRPFVWRGKGSCVALVPATLKMNLPVRGKATVAFYPPERQSELLALVKATRASCAYVIAYIHWGVEKAHHPGKDIRALAHALVDAGADLVVGHHPHVLQGVEHHRGKVIVYSLGNTVFSNPMEATRRTGILQVELTAGAQPTLRQIEMIPLRIERAYYVPRPAKRGEAEDLLRRVQDYSRPFGTQVVMHQGRLRFLAPSDVLPP
jgi:poly-gamma-glutamate synthesis protein (capsule biosynthesis protein)